MGTRSRVRGYAPLPTPSAPAVISRRAPRRPRPGKRLLDGIGLAITLGSAGEPEELVMAKFVNFRAIMEAPPCDDDAAEPVLTAEELDEDGDGDGEEDGEVYAGEEEVHPLYAAMCEPCVMEE